MTSKLKCPFCGEDIVGVPNLAQTRTIGFRCYNIQCKAFSHFMPVFILQALIQAKQDLAKAIDVIDTVRQHKRGTAVICTNDIAAYCDRAIEQITHDNSEKANSVEHKE